MNLPTFGLKGLSVFSVSAALMACIGHAAALDNTIATSTHRLLIGDFNGDYAADVLAQGHRDDEHAVSLSDGAVSQRWRDGFLGLAWNRDDRTLVVGDFNGDASSDLLLQAATPATLTELVHADTTGEVGKANQSIGDYYLGLRWDAAHRQLIVGDFNGDSRDDIFLQGKQAADRHGLALAEANGTFTSLALEFPDSRLNLNWSVANTGIVAGDFDGNGVSELLLQPNTSGNVLRIGNRTGLLDEIVQSLTPDAFGINWHRADHQLVVGDFNGDGSDDVFLLATRADDGSALVTGGTSGLSGISERIDGIAGRDHVSQILVGDFDADGIDDLVLLFDTPELAPLALLRSSANARALDAALRQLGLLKDGQALRTLEGHHNETHSATTDGSTTSASITTTDTAQGFSTRNAFTTTESLSALSSESGVQTMMASAGSPPAASAVGVLAGGGGVSGGSASYSIPIVLPPGRAGMQPEVSLSYSSRSGNGIAGIGWGLNAGQSSIHRCANTVARDGFSRSAVYDSALDKLCLDGQRLNKTSGTYGATGAIYRTEMESYQKITETNAISSTSSSFTVEQNDGGKRYYTKAVVPVGATQPDHWLLTKVADGHGNEIVYNYTLYSDTEWLLTSIVYTGQNGVAGNRKVVFNYEDRCAGTVCDYETSYASGGRTRMTQRLASVQTFVANTTLIRTYTLGYSLSRATQRTLLQWVQECAGSLCLPATTFSWDDEPVTYVFEKLKASGTPQFQSKRWLHDVAPQGDFNGDGVLDWVANDTGVGNYVNAEGVITGTHSARDKSCLYNYLARRLDCLQPDFNFDGITDGLQINVNTRKLEIAYTANDGSGSIGVWTATDIQMALASSSQKEGGFGDDEIRAISDFNADGWPDLLIYQVISTKPYLMLYPHSKNSTTPYSTATRQTLLSLSYNCSSTPCKQTGDARPIGDMDGNGLPDLLSVSTYDLARGIALPGGRPNGINFLDVTVAGAAPTVTTRSMAVMKPANDPLEASVNVPDALFNYFADVNGDGLTDWLSWRDYGASMVLRLNTGNGRTGVGFEAWQDLGVASQLLTRSLSGGNNPDEPYSIEYPRQDFGLKQMDIDGDGRPELLIPGQRKVSACAYVQPQGWTCDDALYGTYPESINVTSPINTGEVDEGLYEYDAIVFTEQANHTWTTSRINTGMIGSASQAGVFDMYGKGLPDFVTMVGCRASASYCTMNAGQLAALKDADNLSVQSGAYINRNRGSATGIERYRATDMLRTVSDGVGNEQEWTYRPLTSDQYTVGANKFYDSLRSYLPANTSSSRELYFVFASSMYVVAEEKTRHHGTPVGDGYIKTKYRYASAVYNASGRGLQGFRTIITESDKDVRSTSTFEQLFPLTGQLASQSVQRASDNKVLSNTTNTLRWYGPTTPTMPSAVTAKRDGNGPIDNTTYLAYIKTSTTTSSDLNSSIGSSQTDTTLDGNGCPTAVNTTVSDVTLSHNTANSTVFAAGTFTPFWYCKKNSDAVTKTLSYVTPLGVTNSLDLTKVVNTAYTWTDTIHRQPRSTTVTVDGGRSLTTTYTYDYDASAGGCTTDAGDFGNLNCTTVSGSDVKVNGVVTSRVSQAAFDSTGYFPQTLKNAKGHTTTITTDAASGKATSIIDPNGITTTMTYDVFGRLRTQQLMATTAQTVTYGDCTSGTYTRYGVAFASAATPLPVCSDVPNAKYVVTAEQPGVKPFLHSYYDARGRVLRTETRTLGGTTSIVDNQYDAYGRINQTSAPWNKLSSQYWTSFTGYDVLDRPASKSLPNGEGRSGLVIGYQYNGLTTTVNVGGSKPFSISRSKNALGQWMSTTDQGDDNSSNKLTTNFRYDAAGNPVLISRTPQGGSEIRNTARYNNVGHKLTMTDPERGTWTFSSDVLGELLQQTDAKAQNTWFDYDLLGRPLARYESLTSTKPGTATASWTYDTAARDAGGANTNTYGLPATAIKVGEVSKTFSYNANALLKQTQISLTPAGETARNWTVSQTYDGELRPATQTYPSGQLTVTNAYDSDGFLSTLADGAHIIEHNVLADAFGNLEQQRYGYDEAIWQQSWFDDATGRITGICSKTGSYGGSAACTGSLQALDYGNVMGNSVAYDDYGNLLKQQNYNNGVTETFAYDLRQRLTNSSRNSNFWAMPIPHTYSYDALGNLKSKTDYLNNIAAALNYGSAYGKGPHQVAEVRNSSNTLLASYNYDLNGNLTSSTDNQSSSRSRSLVYNLQMVPTSVSMGASNSSAFSYDEGNERYFEKHVDGSTTTKLWKLGKLFEQKETWVSGSKTEDVQNHYVGQHGLLKYYPSTLVRTWNFLLTDRMGSVDTVVNQSNAVQERHGYDPFGKPRKLGWDADARHPTYNTSALLANLSQRGYTGHDHIDSVGLIHMNGRMYDPELGRFLGVDPFMQAPLNSQSLNPYSYVMNNPVMGTDPTGYVSGPLGGRGKCGGVQSCERRMNKLDALKEDLVKAVGDVSWSSAEIKDAVKRLDNGSRKGLEVQVTEVKEVTKTETEKRTDASDTETASSSDENRIEIVGTDSNLPADEINTEKRKFTLSRSEFNAEKGYDSDNEAVLAQFRAYNSQYKAATENGNELTGLIVKEGGRYFFSTMYEVPVAFKASIALEGMDPANVAGSTHTHPDSELFNGLDYVTPATGNRPFFVRTKSGNAYRWEPAGAQKYSRYLAGLQRSGSVRSHDTAISDPKKWGISSICPGGDPCL